MMVMLTMNNYYGKLCPKCGYAMVALEERYYLNTPYIDKWYECENCGYCIDRNSCFIESDDFYED